MGVLKTGDGKNWMEETEVVDEEALVRQGWITKRRRTLSMWFNKNVKAKARQVIPRLCCSGKLGKIVGWSTIGYSFVLIHGVKKHILLRYKNI